MDITVALANLGAASTMVKGLVDLRDRQKLAAVQADLTERLLEAQTHLVQLLGMLAEKTAVAAELQERVRVLERNQLERGRYELAEIAVGRDLAYRLKAPGALMERADEPPHFLCQPCLDIRGHKAVLRMSVVWGTDTYTCPACKAEFVGAHREG